MKPKKYKGFDFVLRYSPHVISDTNIEYHSRVSAMVLSGGLDKLIQRVVMKIIKIIFATTGNVLDNDFKYLLLLSKITHKEPINHRRVKEIKVIFRYSQIIFV